MSIGRQYLPTVSTKVLLSPGGSPTNQDRQKIAPDNGLVVVCLKSESSAYVAPPGVVITNVSRSLVRVNAVRDCL